MDAATNWEENSNIQFICMSNGQGLEISKDKRTYSVYLYVKWARIRN